MAKSKQARLYPTAWFGMSLQSNAKEALMALEAGIREKVLRPAAYAGAVVFYNEVHRRVPRDQGGLEKAIYHVHVKSSTPDKQVYHIGPNKSKAPHWHHAEYGHYRINKVIHVNGRWVATKERLPEPVWVPGTPYMRPTFDAKKNEALSAMQKRFGEKFSELTRSLKV